MQNVHKISGSFTLGNVNVSIVLFWLEFLPAWECGEGGALGLYPGNPMPNVLLDLPPAVSLLSPP